MHCYCLVLAYLVMDLVEDPHFVVMNGVVLNSLVDIFGLQSIHDFNAVEPTSKELVDVPFRLKKLAVPNKNTS